MFPGSHPLPSALRATARWRCLGGSSIPVMLVHPDWGSGRRVPVVIWVHGRTAHKELDPGRYLRLMRSGIGVCAVDLPGHGERAQAALQEPHRALDVVMQMADELDEVVAALSAVPELDTETLGVGGMSAGGMAVLSRLCRPHGFTCVSVEAASGSWRHQRHRAMFRDASDRRVSRGDPILNLAGWRELPLQAFHSRLDEWVAFAGQEQFIETLRRHYRRPELIDFVVYDRTGAPGEHVGFGQRSAEAKNRQRDFFIRHLQPEPLDAASRPQPATVTD
ncbi:MAG: alpha/beta hydrolase family protein [Planctomycetota bacterium]|jgi:dienelactone hydrolase